MMVCLSDIWNRIVRNKDEHKNKATWVYLDEFYLMVQTESSAIMLQEYFKRCRKYHGIMTGITQDIEDLLITPEGRGIFNNSGFVAMLSQSNIGRSEIQEQFDVSDALIDYIKDKPLGTGLLYTGQPFMLDTYLGEQYYNGTIVKNIDLGCDTAHFEIHTKYGSDEFHTGADGYYGHLYKYKQGFGMDLNLSFDAEMFDYEEIKQRMLKLFPERKKVN